jgi:hypothetical protein
MSSQFKPPTESQRQPGSGRSSASHAASQTRATQWFALILSWAAVSLPLAWGVEETLRKALALFE